VENTASRRTRPAKPALTREWIVEETVRIMREEGFEKATMRRVAARLDTGAASLYVYFPNNAELHAAALDQMLSTATSAETGWWRDRLDTLLDNYAEVLFALPGLARSAVVVRPLGPNSIRVYDQLLGLLIEGGADPGPAAWGVNLLLQYVTATAAEHSSTAPKEMYSDRDPQREFAGLARAIADADSATAPNLARHGQLAYTGTPRQRMQWAISVIVEGIRATATPGTETGR